MAMFNICVYVDYVIHYDRPNILASGDNVLQRVLISCFLNLCTLSFGGNKHREGLAGALAFNAEDKS